MKKYIETHPIIMIIVGIFGISLSSILVKYSQAPAAVTATFRLAWTVLLMTPVVAVNSTVQQELRGTPRKTLLLCALSGLCLAVHFVLWFESLSHTTVASSTTIVCTEVIWVSLGFCLFMKGKLSGKVQLAIAVTIAGSVLIAYADSVTGEVHLYGDMLALLAAVAVAVYTLIGRIVRKSTSTTVYTYLVYVACALVLIVMCLLRGYEMWNYGWSAVVVGFLLAVFSTILGHSIFSWCLKYFSPSFVSASKLCEPVVAAVLAGILFGESPTPWQLLGGIMILGGVFYYSLVEQKES